MSADGEINVAVKAEGVDEATADLGGEGDGDGVGGALGGGGGGGGSNRSAFVKGGVLGGILASLDSIISTIEPILDIMNAFLAPVSVLLLRLLEPFMRGMIMLLPFWMDFIGATLDFLDFWESVMNDVYAWLLALPGNIWSAIESGAAWIANGAVNIGNAVWEMTKQGFDSVVEWLKGIWDALPGTGETTTGAADEAGRSILGNITSPDRSLSPEAIARIINDATGNEPQNGETTLIPGITVETDQDDWITATTRNQNTSG